MPANEDRLSGAAAAPAPSGKHAALPAMERGGCRLVFEIHGLVDERSGRGGRMAALVFHIFELAAHFIFPFFSVFTNPLNHHSLIGDVSSGSALHDEQNREVLVRCDRGKVNVAGQADLLRPDPGFSVANRD